MDAAAELDGAADGAGEAELVPAAALVVAAAAQAAVAASIGSPLGRVLTVMPAGWNPVGGVCWVKRSGVAQGGETWP